MIEGKSIILRCDHGGCCPTVTRVNQELVLTDDYGGSIRLTLKQAMQLQYVLESNELTAE
jgi:hypothetical protein